MHYNIMHKATNQIVMNIKNTCNGTNQTYHLLPIHETFAVVVESTQICFHTFIMENRIALTNETLTSMISQENVHQEMYRKESQFVRLCFMTSSRSCNVFNHHLVIAGNNYTERVILFLSVLLQSSSFVLNHLI